MEVDLEITKQQSRKQQKADSQSQKSEDLFPGIAPRSKSIKKAEKTPSKIESKKELVVKNIDEFEKFPIYLKVVVDDLTFRISLMPKLDILTLQASMPGNR